MAGIRQGVLFGLAAWAATLLPVRACLGQTFDDAGGAFAPTQSITVGAAPYAPLIADLNADGKPDLVVGTENTDSLAVLLGSGGGSFGAPTAFAAGDGAQGAAVADLNADGKPDIAIANLFASTVSVFLGNGSGGFALAASPATGANPHALVVVDFNGDGKPDLATANGGGGNASILLGNGDGSFGAAVNYVSGGNPRDIACADFNGDGKQDLVVTNEGGDNLSILLGNGSGGFGTASTYAAGDAPQTVAVGDLNGDGKPDVVVATANTSKVVVYTGVGDGSLAAKPDVTAGHTLSAAALVDLDGNGKLDLVIARGDAQLEIRMGLGNGQFGAMNGLTPGGNFTRIALADLNGDGKPDLVASTPIWDVSRLHVSLNESVALDISPSPTVDRGSSYSLRKPPLWINRQTSGTYPAAFPFSHAGYADIDRDGDMDFLRTFSNNADRLPVQVMVNDGSGNFTDRTATRLTGSQPGVEVARKVLAGDYNGDGWPDFFIAPHGVDVPPFPGEYPQLFLSNGDGTLHYQTGFESQVGFHHGGASADVDGNGTIDILVSDATAYLLLNDGAGHFTRNTSRLPYMADGQPYTLAAAELVDVDGDGYMDLLSDGYEPNGRFNTVYWGGANGVYRQSRSTALPTMPGRAVSLDFIVEDINGDGRKDILVDRTGENPAYVGRAIQVLRQSAARVFVDETGSRITMDQSLLPFDYFRGQDINGDGAIDILIDDKNDMASGQYAWLNNGSGVFSPYTGPVNPGPAMPSLSIADVAVTEGHAGTQQAVFTVSVNPVAAYPVSFDAYTDYGTAAPGVDYQSAAVEGQVIPAGQASVQFPVTVIGDTRVEGHESFTVNLANALDARIADAQGRGRITNDDLAGLAIRDATVLEGNGGTTTLAFAIELSSAMPSPVYFDIATGGGTATAGVDYVARGQAGRFMDAGRTRQWFEVAILGDATVEPDETLLVTVSNVSGAVLQDGSATGTLANDDGAPLRAAKIRSSATPLRVPRAAAARDRSVKP